MRLENLNANFDSYDEDLEKTSKNLNKNDTALTLIEKNESTIIILPIENSNSLSNDHDIIIKENRKNNEFKQKEGGWGWIVLLCVIWSYGLAVSWYTNFNLIIPYFIDYYNQTEHYTVFYSEWVGSLSFGVTLFLSAPSSYFIDVFGCAKVSLFGNVFSAIGLLFSALIFYSKNIMQLHLISFGLIFGTGQSLVYASSFAILPHYFDRRLGFVMGILNAGSCILIIVTSILMAFLLEEYGLIVTFYMMALLTITGSFTSITYKFQIPRDNKHKDLKNRFLESLGIHIFKNPKFIVWLLATFFGVYGNIVPILTMSHYVTLKFNGFKPEILNVIYGISSGISSILFGILIDALKISLCYNYLITYFIYGLCTLLIDYTNNLFFYCCLTTAFSVFDGLSILSLVPMARETAKSSLYANQAIGYISTISAISLVCAPAATGVLFEIYNNYYLAYLISSISSFLGAFVLLFYPGLFCFKN